MTSLPTVTLLLARHVIIHCSVAPHAAKWVNTTLHITVAITATITVYLKATISEFVKNISINSEKLDALTEAVMTVWEKKHETVKEDAKAIQKRIDSLVRQKYVIVDKIKIVSSVTAIEMLEADPVKTGKEITKLEASKDTASRDVEAVDIHKIVAYVKYFMEHLHELLIRLCNPSLRA